MELLNALLAGFFLWLLVYNAQRKAIGRLRREAGGLVLRVNAAPGLKRKRWPWGLSALLLAVLVLNLVKFMMGKQQEGLDVYFGFAVLMFATMTFAVPINRPSIALEVRERGVLHNVRGRRGWPGRLSYTPWNSIDDCIWIPNRLLCPVRPRLELLEGAIAPEQRAAVTAALGRFVPVYDRWFTLVAQPEKPHERAKPTGAQPFRRRPFQFDLQSVMIFAVVVACAANCYGLHYRRWRPKWEAMARLDTFSAVATYDSNGDVLFLDFSNCATKPGDNDLANLEPLVELDWLDLTGAPVTDAALMHLKRLKKLQFLRLAGTMVTSSGIEDLQRALLDLSVVGPSGHLSARQNRWRPPAAPPR